MDLSQLSDEDLIALKSGDLSKVSDAGLSYLSSQQKPTTQPSAPVDQQKKQNFFENYADSAIGNTLGALRGTADIGNTLINAATAIPRNLAQIPADMMGIENPLERLNQQREQGLNQWTESNQDRPGFTTGRIVANVAGTMGVGGAIAKGVQGLSQAPKALQLAEALKTGGLSAQGAGLGTRIVGGAATGGASAGLIDPKNAGTGAMIGGALPVATKIAGALGRGIGGMVEPFYQGGRERIIGRTINAVAGNQADDALRNLQKSQPLVQGSQPTAGMAAQNPGIAALERAATANSPIATNELALRQAANNEARQAALAGITPDRVAAQQARKEATKGLYETAKTSNVQITPELKNLFSRPSMKNAIARAQKLAEENGEALVVGKDIPADIVESDILMQSGKPFTKEVEAQLAKMSGKGAQYIKMAMDDLTNPSTAHLSGISGNELASMMGTKSNYLGELEKQIPDYLTANSKFAELSRPIAQADVLEEIGKKATNFRGDLTPAALARALSDKTVKSVTGRASATLDDVLDPNQLSTLNNIKQDLLNQDFAQTAGRGVGSNTVQNLAYTNILDQFGVPTAMREFAPAGAVGNILGQAGRLGYKSANERLAQELAEALLNPQSAAQVMQKAREGAISPEVLQLLQSGLRTAPVISAQ